jgi:hypothetical protein
MVGDLARCRRATIEQRHGVAAQAGRDAAISGGTALGQAGGRGGQRGRVAAVSGG